MRAITVRQPWAWAITHGKNVENRSRGTSYRGPLLIHAGVTWSDRGAHDRRVLEACLRTWPQPAPEGAVDVLARVGLNEARYVGGDWGRRAVIAVAELVDSHPDAGCCRPWGESSYTESGGAGRTPVCNVHHLVLANIRPLPQPIPCPGALGLWRPPDYVIAAVEEALPPAELGECLICGEPLEDPGDFLCGDCELDGYDVVTGRRVETREPLARYL
jgi:hypothetical protein